MSEIASILSIIIKMWPVPKAKLVIGVADASITADLLTLFDLSIKNRGKKSVEQVEIRLSKKPNCNVTIEPNLNNVKMIEPDSVWKGIFLKHRGWDGPQQRWQLNNPLHPNHEILIARIQVNPDWPGWQECKSTCIECSIYSKDTKGTSWTIKIPIGLGGGKLKVKKRWFVNKQTAGRSIIKWLVIGVILVIVFLLIRR